MKKQIFIAFATVFLLTLGCNKDNKADKIIDIEKEFTFQLWEQLDEKGGNLQLLSATIQSQKCSGTRIEYTQNIINNKITLTLKALIPPAVCDNKAVPATDTISFGNLAKGTYKLNINLKDVVLNEGTLVVEDKKYSVAMAKTDGIDLSNQEVLRVPRGAIWGYVSYETGQETKLLKFNDNLSRIATPLSISHGDYGYFIVKPSAVEMKSAYDPKKSNVRQLLYNLNGNRSELQGLIQDYRSQGLDIKILTYDGKTL